LLYDELTIVIRWIYIYVIFVFNSKLNWWFKSFFLVIIEIKNYKSVNLLV
jgi:hypothetical protein